MITEDNWLEPPCNITIQLDYECARCGLTFTPTDIEDGNHEEELDVDHCWQVKHMRCPDA